MAEERLNPLPCHRFPVRASNALEVQARQAGETARLAIDMLVEEIPGTLG